MSSAQWLRMERGVGEALKGHRSVSCGDGQLSVLVVVVAMQTKHVTKLHRATLTLRSVPVSLVEPGNPSILQWVND